MSVDEASEGQSSEDRDGRGDGGDEGPASRGDGSVPFLEELFQGEEEGSATARPSS